MNSFKFGTTSNKNLKGIHPDLLRLATRALQLSNVDFTVVQGVRSAAAQFAAYRAGKSQIKSGGRHQYGCAIDVEAIDPATGKATWVVSTGLYSKINLAFEAASNELKIPYRWGGTFSFGDYGHYELPVAKYPNNWRSK